MNTHIESIKSAYSQREKFVLIALTGRTGSGCSTAASILAKSSFKDLDLQESQVREINTNEDRKYEIIYNYTQKNDWKAFSVIEASGIIFSHIIEQGMDEFKEYIKGFQKINEKNKIRISSFPDLFEAIDRLDYIFENQEYCTLNEEKLKKITEKIDGNHDQIISYYRFYIDTLPKLKNDFYELLSRYTCHEEQTSRFEPVKFKKANLYTFLMQQIGNNIRASGKPYISNYSAEHFYCVAERIDYVIQIIRRYNSIYEQYNTRICIDAIRNPYEAFYFKDKYSTFYLMSVNTDESTRRQRLGYLDKDEIASLDSTEFPTGFEHDFEVFFHQNMSDCLEISDIHLYNPQQTCGKYFFLTSQIVRYVCLMLHPGLITPSNIERCMQVAYTAKLNSGCLSRQVGAVITDQGFSIKAVGWNDVPKGQIPCSLRDAIAYCVNKDSNAYSLFELENEEFSDALHIICNKAKNAETLGRSFPYCFKDVYNGLKKDRNQVFTRSLHAEENSFLQLAKYGGQGIKGGCLFTTASPCELCSKKAYQLGIRDIYYIDPYPGIAFQHILNFGHLLNPNLHLFYGAVGTAYTTLYTQRISIKDELSLMTGIDCKKIRNYMEDVDRIKQTVKDIEYIYQETEFIFETRENIHAIERLQVKALHSNIQEISNITYWTGSSFDGMKLSDFKRGKGKHKKESLNQDRGDNTKSYQYNVENCEHQPYIGTLRLSEPLKKGETISYKITIDVKDATHIMNPYYAQMVTIRTKKLVLSVKAKEGLLKNVKKVVYADTNMTPEYEVQSEEIPVTVSQDGYQVFKVSISKPNLNYSYCLEWNFNS